MQRQSLIGLPIALLIATVGWFIQAPSAAPSSADGPAPRARSVPRPLAAEVPPAPPATVSRRPVEETTASAPAARPSSRQVSISEDLRPWLQESGPEEREVIVQAAPGTNVESWARTVESRTGRAVRILAGARALVVRASAEQVRDLASEAECHALSSDCPVTATMESMASMAAIGADQAAPSSGSGGAGITVAVIDSGVAAHVDLAGKVEQALDLRADMGADPSDGLGHGTHVASLIAGVAPG